MCSKIGGLTVGTYSPPPTAPPQPPPPLAAKFALQGDAHVRTDTQIKFLYHTLLAYMT